MSYRAAVLSDKEIKLNSLKHESVEDFIARGGKIQKVGQQTEKNKKKSVKVNAQALLDAAMGTDKEQEVIKFLATQGISVE